MGSPWTHDPPEAAAPADNGRRRRFIVGGVVAAVLLSVGLGVALWPRSTQQDTTSTDAPAPSSRTVQACATWTVNEQTPTPPDLAVAPSVTWSLVGGIAAPSSADAGPASDSPVLNCYAPTSAGALVALSNFYALMQDWHVNRSDLMSWTMADTPSRSYALAEAETRPVPGETPNRQNPTIRGFRFLSYKPADSAQIDLVHEWKGQLVSQVYDLTYEGGDWRIVLPASWEFPSRVVSSTTDMDTSYYTPWGS